MVKVERTFPAPDSLLEESKKSNGSYSEPDVVSRLCSDFHDKYYICELKGLQDPQIEHRLPHFNGKYPERKFDWNNLFLSCGHCNNIKNQRKYDGGIIDCCKDDPEKLICFQFRNEDVFVFARDEDNVQAVLTAQLVMEVFHRKNTGMRIYKSEMRRSELMKEMNKLYAALEEMEENPDSQFTLRKTKALLRRESGFAAFKRCYVREHAERFPGLI